MITVGYFHNCNLRLLVLSNLASFKVTTNHSNLWSFQVVHHPSNLLYFKVILAYSNLSSFEYSNLLSYEAFVGFQQQSVFFCGVKNILQLSRPLVLEKRQANAPVFLLGLVLRRLSNTLLSVCWCQENGTSLRTRGFGKILNNSLSLFYFLSGLSFLPSFFSQLFSCFFPLFFLSFPTHSLSLSCCKFYSPSLSSFPPLPPSFLPSFLHRFPFLSRTLPPLFVPTSLPPLLLASSLTPFLPAS